MASSKQRRMLRRLLRQEGLMAKAVTRGRSRTEERSPEPLWRGVRKRIWGAVSVIAVLLAYAFLLPDISIEKDFDRDPTNPYSQSFYIQNNGWLNATNIKIRCKADTNFSNGPFNGSVFNVDLNSPVIPLIGFRERHSLPCDQMFAGHNLAFKIPN
jgi:hypothetical protein